MFYDGASLFLMKECLEQVFTEESQCKNEKLGCMDQVENAIELIYKTFNINMSKVFADEAWKLRVCWQFLYVLSDVKQICKFILQYRMFQYETCGRRHHKDSEKISHMTVKKSNFQK